MRAYLSRREFLRACGGACAAVGIPLLGVSPTHGQQGLASIPFDMAAIPNNFGRREIIQGAMNVVTAYFRDLGVVQNVYRYLRGGIFLDDKTLRNSNINDTPTNRSNLLSVQIQHLRNARLQGRSWFPRVVFKTADYDKEAWAWGQYNTVTVRFKDRNTSSISGEFQVEVSLRHLGGGGNQSDPRVWGSVIAHEMLHNLGHKHPLRDYRPVWQINVYQNAFYCRGKYNGQLVPGFV